MSDEPATPFTFRPAPAKPSRKTTLEKVEDMELPSDVTHAAVDARGAVMANEAPPKRKRRTRVEMAQAAIVDRASPSDDKMVVLTKCLKLLRSLSHEDVTEAVKIITAVFK